MCASSLASAQLCQGFVDLGLTAPEERGLLKIAIGKALLWRSAASASIMVSKEKNTLKVGGLSSVVLSWGIRELNHFPGPQRMYLLRIH